jgi:hypothetical protein
MNLVVAVEAEELVVTGVVAAGGREDIRTICPRERRHVVPPLVELFLAAIMSAERDGIARRTNNSRNDRVSGR